MDRILNLGELLRATSVWLRATASSDGERGQGLVEYALILILVAIVVIVVLSVVGAQVNNVFSNVTNGLAH